MAGSKILIVDDEPNIVRSLCFALKKEGYYDSIAEGGDQASAMNRESKSNIIFPDVIMPKKNGYDVCQEINSDPELMDIHVVMLPAKDQERERAKGLEHGADEYISKTFRPRKILARARESLG